MPKRICSINLTSVRSSTGDILFSPHNEHRILLTRLLSIALFELNGGWNPILQMMVNAVLHVCAIVLLMVAIRPIMPRSLFLPLVTFAIVLFVLPIGWENLLAGFQSQFYLLVIFSILALMGFAQAQAFDFRWWLSVLCTIGAFLSMASGALVAVASFGVFFLQIVVGVRRSKKDYAALAALLLLSIALVALVPGIPGHEGLKAHSLSELKNALLICLDYPRTNPLIGIWGQHATRGVFASRVCQTTIADVTSLDRLQSDRVVVRSGFITVVRTCLCSRFVEISRYYYRCDADQFCDSSLCADSV